MLFVVCCCYRLSGQCPFVSESRDQLINDIKSLNINYEINPIMQRLSPDCTNMIFDGLLLTNQRYTHTAE